MSFDYLLHDISFANLTMLMATVPEEMETDENGTPKKKEEMKVIEGEGVMDFFGF